MVNANCSLDPFVESSRFRFECDKFDLDFVFKAFLELSDFSIVVPLGSNREAV